MMYGHEKSKYGTKIYQDQHNPNDGENYTHYTSSGSYKGGLSAGVGDGLSHAMNMSVKNAEGVSQNQRPKSNRESAGKGMVIGY